MKAFVPSLLALFLAGNLSHGQLVNGRISGSITDATGAAVPNAQVTLSMPGGSSPMLTTETNTAGLYYFPNVRPATYDLAVEATGFARYIAREVKVDAARENALPPIKIDVQSTQQTVEVVAGAASVQTTNAEVSTTVAREQVANLPVLDRQVSNLIQTQPGVSNSIYTTVNGLRVSFQNMTLDGINIQDNYLRTNALDYVPNRVLIDQVEEFTVTTSNANAAVGGGSGQISATTRSGTNQFHGAGYIYNRNNHFAANDWFNNRNGVERPFLNQNQLGGAFGGPIVKDKLLFFVNYEALRRRQQTPLTNRVLTPMARQGIFSYIDTTTGELRQVNLLAARGATISPAIQQNLSLLPTTINSFDVGDSRPGQLRNTAGLAFNARSNLDRDAFTTRIDFNLSERHSFTGSYQWNNEKTDRPTLGSFYGADPVVVNDNPLDFFSTSWRWTPSPSLVNEVRFGANLTTGSFNIAQPMPEYLLSNLLWTNPVSTYQPSTRSTDTWALQDNANWLKGRHNVAFGYQGQFIRTSSAWWVDATPTYNLAIPQQAASLGFSRTDLPGIGQQDLNAANQLYANLTGIINQQRQQFNTTSATSGFVAGAPQGNRWALNTHALYISDTWRVHPRVVLNLGVRWDYWAPISERDRKVLVARGSGSLRDVLLSNATLDIPAEGEGLWNRDLNNFAPNVGVAWDVFGNGRTALRAGFSRAYVNDETIRAVESVYTAANEGLLSLVIQSPPAGSTLQNPPSIPLPQFRVPRTLAENYETSPLQWVGGIESGLQTPQVNQWNFGIQHEIGTGNVVEVRYVGNKASDLFRAVDYNQIRIRENGFLDDFLRAQRNAQLAEGATGRFDPRYDPGIAGSQPLPVFARMEGGGFLTDPTVQARLREGQVGSLAQLYMEFGLNGDVQFFRNPYTFVSYGLGNYAWSNYHGLQVDFRRRLKSFNVQGNYVFSKALSNAEGAGQTRFEPMLDEGNEALEKSRTMFDITHQFKALGVWEIPFGRGKRWSGGRWLDGVLGNWMLSANWYLQSGGPFSILSERGTVNRGSRSLLTNTASSDATANEINNHVGFFMTGNGPYFVDPAVINPETGRGVAPDGQPRFSGQIFYHPTAGNVGNLQRRMFSGPWNQSLDAAIAKRFPVMEGHTLEFRAEAFNLPNNPSFFPGNDRALTSDFFNINSTNFGRMTYTYNTERRFQFSLQYRF